MDIHGSHIGMERILDFYQSCRTWGSVLVWIHKHPRYDRRNLEDCRDFINFSKSKSPRVFTHGGQSPMVVFKKPGVIWKKSADYRWCLPLYFCVCTQLPFFKTGEYLCLLLVTCHWVGLITSPFLTSKLNMLPCWIYCKSYSLLIGQEPMIHWCLRLKHLRHRFVCREFDFNYFFCTCEYDFDIMCVMILQWFEIRIMNWIQ